VGADSDPDKKAEEESYHKRKNFDGSGKKNKKGSAYCGPATEKVISHTGGINDF